MTSQLLSMISEAISNELMLSMKELNAMNNCQEMGLQGYKRFHRFYSMDRNRHAIMLCNYLVEYHTTTPHLNVNFDSFADKASSLINSLEIMYKSSINQILLLKSIAKIAIDENEDHLMGIIEEMISDQTEESSRYYREIQELSNTNSDKVFIQIHDKCLHEKYKKKEKKYFNYEV